MLLVFIILRYRRRRRRDSRVPYDGRYGNDRGGGKERPGSSGSYNSMANVGAGRDVKDRDLILSPDSGTTKVGGLSRANTVVGGGSSSGRGGGGGGDQWELLSQPSGNPLPKLGVTRRPAGEALTANYAVSAAAERKPLKLAEPPPAKKKGLLAGAGAGAGVGGGGNNDNNNNNNNNNNNSTKAVDDDDNMNNNNNNNKPGSSGGATTGGTTWSVFPKVDPDPKGVLAAAAQREVTRRGSGQQSAANLQKWLQTAVEVSPFGPLDSKSGGPAGAVPAPAAATATTTVGGVGGGGAEGGGGSGGGSETRKGAPPPNRMSEVKWPLQGGQEPGLAYAETPTVSTAAVARSVSLKGVGLPGKPRKVT